MSKKVKFLRNIGVLCSVVVLSGATASTFVFAAETMRSEDANTASEAAAYASDELSSEMEEFHTHMMSGDALKEGEERVLGTLNGEEFCVEVSDTRESGEINTADATVTYTSDELSPEMEEFYTHMMSGDALKEGEEHVLGTLNGEKFCVKVTDVTETSSATYSSASTASKNFTFYTKNVLGIKKNVLKVTSKCTWTKGSKINNLNCSYTTLVSDISCSWNDNFTAVTDTFHTLGLDITYGGKSGIVFFGASLSADLQTLTLDCSADYEL